ncbi:FkbM family methyltransferase [Burkholderia diffusa]|uniref:FkbM family methyltransferase n=1 Tax=Burkholderia diffusa TaxID=488732 RepID=UPI002650E460|nr:FkbM family methyltransferase [Burkholderia diffusa]MDN7903220.1 FkbM family methyltransferase [Burkholderia diffusa]
MVSRDDVVWCYNTFLMRQPESEDVVNLWLKNCRSIRDLVRGFHESPEFQQLASLKAFAKSDETMYYKTPLGFLFPIRMNDPAMYRTYVSNSYEEPETDFIRKHTGAGQHVIDIGARHGWFSCVMSQSVGSRGHVYCYDPDPLAATHVQECITVNRFENVSFEGCALGAEAGRLSFDGVDATLQTNGHVGSNVITVDVKRLDDLLGSRMQPISFIKIDVEGAEHMVFEGARDVIKSDRPIILMELNDPLSRRVSGVPVMDTVAYLREFGYRYTDLDGRPLSIDDMKRAVQGNRIVNIGLFATN